MNRAALNRLNVLNTEGKTILYCRVMFDTTGKQENLFSVLNQPCCFIADHLRLENCLRGEGGGGVFLRIFGRGVQFSFTNSDPILDQNMSFSGTFFQTWPLQFIPIFRPGF